MITSEKHIKPKLSLKPISYALADKIIHPVLGGLYSRNTITQCNKFADLRLSRGLYLGRKLIGVYLLRTATHEKLQGSGIEGLCLAVLPEYRGLGYGKKLIQYSESLNFNFILGHHDKRLGNLHHWLTRRSLLEETFSGYCTYKILKK